MATSQVGTTQKETIQCQTYYNWPNMAEKL